MSYQGKSNSNTYAILALVLGILSFLGGSVLTAIPAWILGKSAMKSIDSGDGNPADRNLAKIGVILGQVAVALSVVGLCFMMMFLGFFGAMLGSTRDSFESEQEPDYSYEQSIEEAPDSRGSITEQTEDSE